MSNTAMYAFACPFERHYCGARRSKLILDNETSEIEIALGDASKFNKTGATKQRGNCYYEIKVPKPRALPALNQYIYQLELTFTKLKYVRTTMNHGE